MFVSSLTDIGLIRKTNEDCLLVQQEQGLFVVADGMGGHQGGQRASTIAVETIESFLKFNENWENNTHALLEAVQLANTKILAEANNSQYSGMGTTITALKISDAKAYIAHIGDSRAYLIRNEQMELLTKDHSLVGELLRSGEISEEEAFNHPHRSVLIRALGTETHVDIDLIDFKLQPRDILLLCTDGLTNHLRDKEILKIIADHQRSQVAEKLVQKALGLGGTDNITVILIYYAGQ